MYNILNKMVTDENKDIAHSEDKRKVTVRCSSCNALLEISVCNENKDIIFGCEYCGSTNVYSNRNQVR